MGYGFQCDVWSWGVLLCELVGGFNPFQGQSVQETYQNILSLNITWPRNMNQACRHLIQGVFMKEPSRRLTIADIKNHSFFQGVDWTSLDETFAEERCSIMNLIGQTDTKDSDIFTEINENDQGSPHVNKDKKLIIKRGHSNTQEKIVNEALSNF